jgi:hypothetical protein
MSPVLAILNVIFIVVSIVILRLLSPHFRKIFILGAFIPLVILVIITLVSLQGPGLGLKEILFVLLRGGFIFAVFSGLLTCYIVTRRQSIGIIKKG